MKHCANPDCRGLKKFGAVSEFNDTATACGDCGGPLTAGPAPDPKADRPAPDPDLELVPVVAVENEADVLLVESLLADAGIPYLAQGEHIQDLFGWGRIGVVNPITGPVIFTVAADQAEDARVILADFTAG